jgi:hypothetical protein
MVVIDGLAMGHRLCAMPKCLNSPTDFRSKKLCPRHQEERSGLCGIVSCTRFALTEPVHAGACDLEAHQELWAAFQSTRSRETYGSYQRVLRNQQGSALRGEDRETAAWIAEGRQNAERVISAPDDPEQTIPHHQGSSVPQPSLRRTQHTWQYRHVHCVETVTRPCGCIIAWSKFPTSESPTNIVQMLEQIFPSVESRPSYFVIDKACRILAMLQNRGQRAAWFQTSRFLVDVFHFKNHHGDPICQQYCNPTPSIHDDPNLVLSIQDGNNPPRLQRAFNTEAAEQLNAWFGGYASQLSHLHPANHDFLVQIMLMYHYNAKTNL